MNIKLCQKPSEKSVEFIPGHLYTPSTSLDYNPLYIPCLYLCSSAKGDIALYNLNGQTWLSAHGKLAKNMIDVTDKFVLQEVCDNE